MALYVEAILLGILQGIAEFLPISSDGHLAVFGKLLGEWLGTGSINPEDDNRLFLMVIVLHLGSLATLLVVYWKDLLSLLKKPRLLGWIVLSTLVTGVMAIGFKKAFREMFNSPTIAALGWLVTAGFLWWADRIRGTTLTLDEMGWKQAVGVGLLQALAPAPGVSRSGTTITAGLLTGLSRAEATRYSFLIAIPAITGAVVLEVVKPLMGMLLKGQSAAEAFPGVVLNSTTIPPLIVGAVVSFLVGLVCLRWLIAFVVQRSLRSFIVYLVVMAGLTLAWQFFAPGLFVTA